MIQIDYFGGTSSDDDVNLRHSRSYDLRITQSDSVSCFG